MSSHVSQSMPVSVASGKPSGGPAAMAAAAAAKARAKDMALSTVRNEQVSWYFTIIMLGLIAVFTMSHWSRSLYSRHSSKGLRKSTFMRFLVAIARTLRHVLIRQIPWFTSIGHIILIFAYLGINITLTVINIKWSSLTNIGKRCGWMALLNMTFITLLSLKNTPLAYLTAYSYERLNTLHQIGGYTTVTYVFVHTVILVQAFTSKHIITLLLEQDQIYGYVAGCSMFITCIAAIWFRAIRYELFYVTHIIMFLLIIIYLPLHIRHHEEKAVYIAIFAAAIWGADRLLRVSHLLWYLHGNRATITPLPNKGTRILLSRSPSRAVPGNHCFVWIPKIRLFESHPFTIVSATETSLELVVAAYDGFTDALHQYAIKNPGAVLRASVDGPYGATPNFVKTADKVILIAGGSGASFTFGVALDMIKKLGESSQTTIDFVWSVKDHSSLDWYRDHLATLRASPRVATHIHVSRETVPSQLDSNTSIKYVSADDEKHNGLAHTVTHPLSVHLNSKQNGTDLNSDIEKVLTCSSRANPWDSTSSLEVLSGRPEIDAFVRSIVGRSLPEERLAIAACGPEALMKDVRNVSADMIRINGPSVELHCEQFGW